MSRRFYVIPLGHLKTNTVQTFTNNVLPSRRLQCALDVDQVSGRIAYLAGSVVVMRGETDDRQSHIVNETRKAFTSLAFSQDGKTLLTGKCDCRERARTTRKV